MRSHPWFSQLPEKLPPHLTVLLPSATPSDDGNTPDNITLSTRDTASVTQGLSASCSCKIPLDQGILIPSRELLDGPRMFRKAPKIFANLVTLCSLEGAKSFGQNFRDLALTPKAMEQAGDLTNVKGPSHKLQSQRNDDRVGP
ncbi:hypothetical protein MG293_013065 [Ovis ammon polii]|uniref:Uncharacterized protein n=1 Tax=Ovis ammon polii TaxID=230172 RepID=A0AAD4Y731_OVIAM|nr:hypothetical protein MG293_013065 [Ovis ammon polii]